MRKTKIFTLSLAIVLCFGLCFIQNVTAKCSVNEAISWAEDQIGSNYDSQCDQVWAYNCWHFCVHTYDMLGTNPAPLGSAIEAWNYNGDYYGDRHTDQNIPRGALVFFATTTNNVHGHVGLYIGDGKIIDAWVAGVRNANLSDGGDYLGWRWPIAWTDDSPANNQVIKFSDSSDCFLQSNSSLWKIGSEQIYAYLGFAYDCNFAANWDYLTELDALQRSNYAIRQESLVSISNPSIGKNIAYKVVEKVGPIVCLSMYVDPTKIYLFGDDNKFHHVSNEQVYYDLGYADDWSDVVEISPDLFMLYGENYEINSVDDALWISFSYASIVPLSLGDWTYRVGHTFTESIFSGGNNAAIKYQGQEVPLFDAINNGWIYYTAYCYDGISWSNFDIRYGQFAPQNQYFIYSFVSGAEFKLYGSFESTDERQAVQDMNSVAENNSRFLFKELYSLEIVPDWSPYWTLRVMAYQISPSSQAWFNHATNISDPTVRYVTYRDPDTGQWTNWQRVY